MSSRRYGVRQSAEGSSSAADTAASRGSEARVRRGAVLRTTPPDARSFARGCPRCLVRFCSRRSDCRSPSPSPALPPRSGVSMSGTRSFLGSWQPPGTGSRLVWARRSECRVRTERAASCDSGPRGDHLVRRTLRCVRVAADEAVASCVSGSVNTSINLYHGAMRGGRDCAQVVPNRGARPRQECDRAPTATPSPGEGREPQRSSRRYAADCRSLCGGGRRGRGTPQALWSRRERRFGPPSCVSWPSTATPLPSRTRT